MILRMDTQKKLSMVKSAVNYQHENCAEYFTVILPEVYNDYALRNCTVSLCWHNKNNEGDVHLLSFKEVLYKESLLESNPIYLTYNHTSVVGLITMWLEIDFANVADNKVSVLKTNRVTMSILPSTNIDEVIDPVVEQSILTSVAAMGTQMNTFVTKEELEDMFKSGE